ncbi:MAG: Fic family protein [Cyclobacteriaceae bacterium]
MRYNWQLPDWPDFQYNASVIEDIETAIFQHSGRSTGLIEGLSDKNQVEAIMDMLLVEALKSFEIEGEYLSRKDVMSSIKNNLGIKQNIMHAKDPKSKGAADLMVDARNTFADKLTQKKLFEWHRMIFSGNTRIKPGKWRHHSEPMQVVSGTVGKEKIHFEAPPSSMVAQEMKGFLLWFNNSHPDQKGGIKRPVLRSAIAHLYFESIHPFEDGNGRIGRTIAEKALSQGFKQPILISISNTIEANRKAYYNALKEAQQSYEITRWLKYFAQVVYDAQVDAEKRIKFSLKKSKFFDKWKTELNTRQLKAINRMLSDEPNGFEGGMNARKYISLTKTSKATATRDLQDLVKKEIFIPSGGGRSTNYAVNLD